MYKGRWCTGVKNKSQAKKISQIEKEGSSIIFGIRKFHKFRHGRPFVFKTDHRLLISILESKQGIQQIVCNVGVLFC